MKIPRREFIQGTVATAAYEGLAAGAQSKTSNPDFEAISALKGEGKLNLPAQRTAFLVIDMQRYFVNDQYPFGQSLLKINPDETKAYFQRAHNTVVPNLQKILKLTRSLAIPTYFTAFGSLRDDGRDLPSWARLHNQLGEKMVGKPWYPSHTDPSWQIHDSLKPASGEQVLPKTTSGPLASTRLDQTFHLLGVDTVVVGGLVTNVCVTQAAREFADRGFTVVIPEDACTCGNEAAHWSALETFASVFGRVSSTAQILAALH